MFQLCCFNGTKCILSQCFDVFESKRHYLFGCRSPVKVRGCVVLHCIELTIFCEGDGFIAVGSGVVCVVGP